MAKYFQIELSESERNRLVNRIEQDYQLAKSSHTRHMDRCARWMQKWEARVDEQPAKDRNKPNHVMPLIQWQVFNKLARDMQALLGDDAEITAQPTGPSDRDKVAKIGRWMTSRVFDQMKILNPLCEFLFRRILFGWSAAYRPWVERKFTTIQNGQEARVCDYFGPAFMPIEPDDLIIPPERGVTSIQDFSWVIHRRRVTIDDLQRGAGELYYWETGTPEFLDRMINWAQQPRTSRAQDQVRTERERSEGVDYDSYMQGRRSLEMYEWYGFWRPLRGINDDAGENEVNARQLLEREWVVRFLPDMREIVGIQDLVQLYPKMRRRRPFVESTLIKDGTYRPKGFGALLEDLEDDATANSRLFTQAGELSVGPIIFFRDGGGMRQGKFRVEPGVAYATEDPNSINVLKVTPNLDYAMARQQDILSVAERVTGITDQSLGRAIDRPNAPRTATGQLALIEEGNIRAYLDDTILREDMEQIIEDFWDLDVSLIPKDAPNLFFRVTEEQAGGLFDIKEGGAFMRPDEFGGKYDFKLKFATTVYARQAKKQEFLAFYQTAVMNPLCMQNPTALWWLLNGLAKQFSIDFSDIIPKPPELDRPKTPDQEWTEMLEGDPVNVNPMDDDQQHIEQHTAQLEAERKDPDRDIQAIGLVVKHILDHQQQLRTKQLMSTLTNQLMNSLNPPQTPAQQTVNQLTQMYGQPQQPMMQGPQGPQGPPQMQPPGPAGDIPGPPNGVGAQQVPQPVEGMM